MSSPVHPCDIRFVPETSKDSRLQLRLSFRYTLSFDGIFTIVQLVCSFFTFVTAVSSQVYNYELTDHVIYVTPRPTSIFVLISTFSLFYIDLLAVAAALLSNFNVDDLQLSLFYLMSMISGTIFNIASGLSLSNTIENITDYALSVLCFISGLVYSCRSGLIIAKIFRHQETKDLL